MLKRWLSVLGVMSILCLSYVQEGFTAAFEGPGVGVRPLSMGGAFIGLADNWSAVIWNPAGLTQLKEKGAGFSLDYAPVEASDGNSVANRPLPEMNRDQGDIFFQLGGEPTAFNKKEVKSKVYLPTLVGYTQVKGFVIGGAFYVPMGYSSEWTDSKGVVKEATYNLESYEKVVGLTVAKEIIPQLSLGLGVNLLIWEFEKRAKKITDTYTYNFEMDGDGEDIEGVLALHYSSPDKTKSLGFVYRTGSKISLKGKAETNYPLPPLPPRNEQSNFNRQLQHPTTFGLGIAYKPIVNLILTADWNWTDWSKQKTKITFSQQGAMLRDKNEDLGWKDVNKIRLGAEYKLNETWQIRAGLFTDPSPVPEKAVSLTNLIDIDRVFYTFGAGYQHSDWQVDMGMMHTKGDKTIEGVIYERKCTSLHTAINRRF